MRSVRPIRVVGDIGYVTLTRGYVAIIDAKDVGLAEGWNWTAHVSKRADGSIRSVYAKRRIRLSCGKQKNVFLHRVILNAPKGVDTDHISGDGLDNRRSNLRLATRSQNNQNQGLRPDNNSGARGVNWHKQAEKWHATIQVGGKRRSLGLFPTIDAAASAYAKASAELHGEFGRTA